MYGLIGKLTTNPGKRDELIAIMLGGIGNSMPGCLSYIIAEDPEDADGMWITEVWDSEASHQASLAIPAVQQAIAKGRALIAGFSNRVVTSPVGGYGLAGRA
jgi:quinol monooxygenase YgiN